MNIAVLVSGGGTNLQALIDFEKQNKDCPYKIVVVMSDHKDAYAIERAKNANIPVELVSPYAVMGAEVAKAASREEKRNAVSDKVLEYCKKYNINYKILKTSHLYGINHPKNDKKPINTMLFNILNNKNITINFDEEIYLTYIEDFCAEITRLISVPQVKNTFELCSKNKVLLSDYAKLIKQISNSTSKIEIKNSNIINLSYNVNSDLSNPTSLLDGLIKTINFTKMMYFS